MTTRIGNDNQIQVFRFKDQVEVRAELKNGEPWFIAKDVCEALEITDSRTATARLDDDEKGAVLTRTPGGVQELSAVSEAGLYNLVLGSRKPEAKSFKRWITHEVLPSIRKTGRYEVTDGHELEEATANLFGSKRDIGKWDIKDVHRHARVLATMVRDGVITQEARTKELRALLQAAGMELDTSEEDKTRSFKERIQDWVSENKVYVADPRQVLKDIGMPGASQFHVQLTIKWLHHYGVAHREQFALFGDDEFSTPSMN